MPDLLQQELFVDHVASVFYEYKEGVSPESILLAYPGLLSLENVYGAITYYLAHQPDVENYLVETGRIWERSRSRQRIPEELRQRLERAKKQLHSAR